MTGSSDECSMAKRPARIVDGHVHEWDPSKADWYPFLQSADALVGIGCRTRLRYSGCSTRRPTSRSSAHATI
jgi:hypothetical protein